MTIIVNSTLEQNQPGLAATITECGSDNLVSRSGIKRDRLCAFKLHCIASLEAQWIHCLIFCIHASHSSSKIRTVPLLSESEQALSENAAY